MSGEDVSSWVESFAEYFEPVSKATSGLTDQIAGAIGSYDFPPAVVEAYNSGAAMVEGVNPLYLGAGAMAMSGLLVLACGCCATPKKRKNATSKSKKKPKSSKSKPASMNGVPQDNGSGRAGSGMAATRNGGGSPPAASRAVGTKKSSSARGGAAGLGPSTDKTGSSKPAEKPTVKMPHSQVKGKGKPPTNAPPVITEEIEGAKKRTRKKKPAKVALAAAPVPKKANAKGSTANGSSPSGAGGSRAEQKTGDSAGVDPYRGQNGGGGTSDWQTRYMGSPEGEWETVSHKRSKPRKEKTAAANDASVIPGGLGL